MKVVMYHYVRQPNADLPYFNFLHVEDFERQLDYFLSHYRMLEPLDIYNAIKQGIAPEGIVLSFDDGLKDHFTYVLPALMNRGLKAFFFINTLWYECGRMPDVHAIHLLLGKYGGAGILVVLKTLINDEMVLEDQVTNYHHGESPYLTNNAEERTVKEILNYFLKAEYRRKIIDTLMEHFFPDYDGYAKRLYMTAQELEAMAAAGMVIGGHTVSHPVLSQLSAANQLEEITGSASFAANIIGNDKMKVFCYPYGYRQTINEHTISVMQSQEFDFAFMVDPRDVTEKDIKTGPYTLPRYDCNLFPYGSLFVK